MKIIETIRSDITLTAVCDKGYNSRDMTSYYCGTFLIWNSPVGSTIVYCQTQEEKGTLSCETFNEHGRQPRQDIPISELFRFTPRQGYYLTENGKILSYTLPTTRSYKKGINRELLRLRYLNGGGFDSLARQAFSLMLICSEPTKTKRSGAFVLSQRLAVAQGKIYSFFGEKTVGSYRDGIITTPFASIVDRVNQLHGDIECRLETL